MYLLYLILGGVGSGVAVLLGAYLRRTSPLLYGIALGSTVSVTAAVARSVPEIETAKVVIVLGLLTGGALIVGAVRLGPTR